jgi:hypothetical protein
VTGFTFSDRVGVTSVTVRSTGADGAPLKTVESSLSTSTATDSLADGAIEYENVPSLWTGACAMVVMVAPADWMSTLRSAGKSVSGVPSGFVRVTWPDSVVDGSG